MHILLLPDLCSSYLPSHWCDLKKYSTGQSYDYINLYYFYKTYGNAVASVRIWHGKQNMNELQAWQPEIYLDFIVLSDGHRADVVFLPQLLGERGGHYFSSDVRRCIEVPFAVLAAVWGHKRIELHFGCRKNNSTLRDSLLKHVSVIACLC